jgi:pimeloyl-ACP methyl ester carboxylesterase
LAEYADAVVDALGDRKDLVVVAQSFGGFTAPLVCERVPVDLMVLVAPMIPAPGEAPNDYWTGTNYKAPTVDAGGDWDEIVFYHDVPPELAAEAKKRERAQSDARMNEPSPLRAWPDVPTKVLLCRDDRLFPADYLRRVAKERLEVTPDEIDSGHCVALSRPKELADQLVAYLA